MNDRELLELAAKAAGVDLFVYGNEGHEGFQDQTAGRPWNPLTDDGDALRLAVKLQIDVECVEGPAVFADGNWSEPAGDDPYAATRRAIVRAATEIGRAMP